MINISLEELEFFLEWSEKDFSSWFVEESIAYFCDDPAKSMMAFSPLEHLIIPGRERTEADCLVDVFRALGAYNEQKTQFNYRVGLASAYGRLAQEWKPSGWDSAIVLAAMHLLLHVGKDVACRELVAVMEKCFSNIAEIYGDYEKYWVTFYESLAVVAAEEDADSISRLVAAQSFREYMAPMAFLALCRADKKRFPTWLEKLRPSLARLHRSPMQSKYAYMSAQKFACHVETETAAQLLCLTCMSPNMSLENTDNWLLETLFAELKSPWELTSDDDGYRLGWRSDPIRSPIRVLTYADEMANNEYDFVAALGRVWKLGKEASTVNHNSLIHKYNTNNHERKERNVLCADQRRYKWG